MNKKIIIIAIIAVLSMFLIPASFAIYKKGTIGNSAISLARWSVTLDQDGVEDELTIIPGFTTATYTLNVESLSEVDLKYDIVFSNLPSGIEVSIDDGNTFIQESSGTITIPNAGTILYDSNGKTDTKTIIIRGISNAEVVNDKIVTVNVIAKQIV